MLTVALCLRLHERPPPKLSANLLDALVAARQYAQGTRWVDAHDVVVHGTLPAQVAADWANARSAAGLRLGVVLRQQGKVFAPHEAPGEISVTTGQDLRDVAQWLDAVQGALSGRRVGLDLQGERFDLQVVDGQLRLTCHDLDGGPIARMSTPPVALAEALLDALAELPALSAAALGLHVPLPGLHEVSQAADRLRASLDVHTAP